MLQDKMAEYIANGTELGWLIDPLNRQVFVYRAGLDVEALDWTSKRWTLQTMFRAIPCWRGFAWSWGKSGRSQSLSGTKSAISSWNTVGMARAAAQEVFSEFLSNRSLTIPQVRFIEMVIDQLTARGVMEPSALYEAPFSSVHAGGPEALFAGKSNVIEGIFEKLKALDPESLADAG